MYIVAELRVIPCNSFEEIMTVCAVARMLPPEARFRTSSADNNSFHLASGVLLFKVSADMTMLVRRWLAI